MRDFPSGRRASSNRLKRSAIQMYQFDASVYIQPICVVNGPVEVRGRCRLYPAFGVYRIRLGYKGTRLSYLDLPRTEYATFSHSSTPLSTTFSIRFCCSVDSVGLSKVAARRGGVIAVEWTGTGRRAAEMGPSVWRGTSGILNASPKSHRNLLPRWGLGIPRLEQRKIPTHDTYEAAKANRTTARSPMIALQHPKIHSLVLSL